MDTDDPRPIFCIVLLPNNANVYELINIVVKMSNPHFSQNISMLEHIILSHRAPIKRDAALLPITTYVLSSVNKCE